jgi:hypothetical protein
MEHLSDWHAFDPDNRTTYPKVDAPVQVRYANGLHIEAMMALAFFSKVDAFSTITGWRYIKNEDFEQS